MDDLKWIRERSAIDVALDADRLHAMRVRLDERIDGGSPRKVRPSRSTLTAFLIAASIMVTGTALAGGLDFLWSEGAPVVVDVGQRDTGDIILPITDPQGRIETAEEFRRTVAEFTPAIRLPEGRDFTGWADQMTASFSEDAWRRGHVPATMVFIAQCAWSQEWLTSRDAQDVAGMGAAVDVMRDIGRSMGDPDTVRMADDMAAGRPEPVRSFFDVNCGEGGLVEGTGPQLDALVKADLLQAERAVMTYAETHGSFDGFDTAAGERLLPELTWTSFEYSNPAAPGPTNIEVARPGRVLLTQESESGATLCVEIRAGGAPILRGRISEEDASVLREPRPGSHPELSCEGAWEPEG